MKRSVNLFYLLSLIVLMSSCISQRKTIYLQKSSNIGPDVFNANISRATIQNGDELYIKVNTTDAENYNFLSSKLEGGYGMNGNQALSLVSYSVDKEGNIVLPYIGKVKVVGLTLEEAAAVIQKSLLQYISQPNVTVKIVNRNVTVLGAVKNAGQFEFSSDRMNILQAIGKAGDLLDYGNRKKVTVVREENNQIVRGTVDLTSDKLLSSEYYYLRPGDIIYIEPLKARNWGTNSQRFTIILSSISTTVLLLNLIRLYK